MTSSQDFAGKTVVVTGSSSGIGRSTAQQLLERGAEVIGLDRNPGDLDIPHIQIDLADSESIGRAADAVPARVDALVNAAGVSSGIGDPLKVVGINFVGLRELTGLIVPRMPADSYIASTSSLAAAAYRDHRDAVLELIATPDRDAALAWCSAHPDELGVGYSLSKEAVVYWTARQAVPLAARGIRINATAPGVTETPILDASIASLGTAYLDAIPKPLGRLATADEQARVLVFLVSAGASYLSGQTLWVDGGYSAGIESGDYPPMAVKR